MMSYEFFNHRSSLGLLMIFYDCNKHTHPNNLNFSCVCVCVLIFVSIFLFRFNVMIRRHFFSMLHFTLSSILSCFISFFLSLLSLDLLEQYVVVACRHVCVYLFLFFVITFLNTKQNSSTLPQNALRSLTLSL